MRVTRRGFMKTTAAGAAGTGLVSHATAHTSRQQTATSQGLTVSQEAEQIYRSSISIDTLMYTQGYSTSLPEETMEAIRASGQTAAFWDVSVSQRWNQEHGRSFDAAIRNIAHWNEELAKHSDTVIRALSAADIEEAKRAGKFALVYLSQDGSILDREVELVRLFHDLGLRVLQLTHNNRNRLGNGYQDRNDARLSHFGVSVVEKCNELGMLIDLSHCGDKTTRDAIELSKQPCLFTHAGCRALYNSLRNRTDDNIRALANKGGVMGIFNISSWLTRADVAAPEAITAHIDHVVNIAGIDHVGFGSDHQMESLANLDDMVAGREEAAEENIKRGFLEVVPKHYVIPELNVPNRMLVLTDTLRKRGYSSSQIEKFLGGNFLRVFREVAG